MDRGDPQQPQQSSQPPRRQAFPESDQCFFADSQLTLGITCKTLFDSVLSPALQPAWMSGGREEKNMSPSCGARTPA